MCVTRSTLLPDLITFGGRHGAALSPSTYRADLARSDIRVWMDGWMGGLADGQMERMDGADWQRVGNEWLIKEQRFESRIARISTTSSLRSGLARLREPAMTSTLLTARMPKS
eukprot:115168-Chlamydomonas_euryale.AAC.1